MKKILLGNSKKYYKANLHCHSTISDGAKTPEELKEMYMNQGYSIIAYTDHDIMLPHFELADENFLPLTGFEIEINEKMSNDVNLKDLCETLRDMEKCGSVYVTKKGKYTLYENTHLKVGRLSVNKAGFGFVIMEGEPDIHIKKENMNGALHNDLVACEYISDEEGKIIRILDRSFDTVIGEYSSIDEHLGKISLDDPRVKMEILIDEKQKKPRKSKSLG